MTDFYLFRPCYTLSPLPTLLFSPSLPLSPPLSLSFVLIVDDDAIRKFATVALNSRQRAESTGNNIVFIGIT